MSWFRRRRPDPPLPPRTDEPRCPIHGYDCELKERLRFLAARQELIDGFDRFVEDLAPRIQDHQEKP